MKYDPIGDDPVRNSDFPTIQAGITFESKGDLINGVLLITHGQGPHPTILLLHGFPGYERNFDLAQTFRRAGWNVLIFHYRGSWGSQGSYSFNNCIEDVSSALDFLSVKESSDLYRVDPQRIVIIGHSMGGFYALMGAINNPSINSVASIAGVNMGDFLRANRDNQPVFDTFLDFFKNGLPPLRGTSADKLLQESLTNAEKWNLLDHVNSLANRSLLLIGGSLDTVVPVSIHHKPLVDALTNKNATDLTSIVIDADHGFTDKRIALTRIILKWLENQR